MPLFLIYTKQFLNNHTNLGLDIGRQTLFLFYIKRTMSELFLNNHNHCDIDIKQVNKS